MRKWIILPLVSYPSLGMAQNGGDWKNFLSSFWESLSNPNKLGGIIFIILAGILIDWLLKKWIDREDSVSYKRRLRRLRWFPLLRFILWFTVVILIGIQLLKGLDMEVLWPPLTALALGIGLALKDGLMDLLSGLWLIFERPFQIGDRISADGHYGEVTRISIRSTQITTLDDNVVTIPNSVILNSSVANANTGNTDCMAVVNIWLPPNTNLPFVRNLAYEAAITSPYLNFDKKVTILFQDYIGQPPGTVLKVKAYVLAVKFEKPFEGDVTETVKNILVKEGVYQSKEEQKYLKDWMS